MHTTISDLLNAYERGTIARRHLLTALAALVMAGRAAAADAVVWTRIDHVSLQVSDLEKSKAFYSDALGLAVVARNENTLQLGRGKTGFLVLHKGGPPATVDHFAIGVESLDKVTITAALRQRGVATGEDPGGAGFHVADPDGYKIQIYNSPV